MCLFTVACLTPSLEGVLGCLFVWVFFQPVRSLKAISGNIDSQFKITQTEMMIMISHRVLL